VLALIQTWRDKLMKNQTLHLCNYEGVSEWLLYYNNDKQYQAGDLQV